VIVYAWVNNEDAKRAYESSDDTYRVFRKMLDSGHPPDDLNQLLTEAQKESLRTQATLVAPKSPPPTPRPCERDSKRAKCPLFYPEMFQGG
jgi:hypothetical protein